MTVQNQNVKNVYRGNGSATVFPFTFAINKEHPEYIHVYITNDGDKAVETNDFTCDMDAKTITYPKTTSSAAKLLSTQRLTIYRLLPYTQELNLVNQGPFFAEDVETELDDLEMQIQQMSENLARCFQIGVEAVDFDMTMELEPDKVICVNSAGNGFEAREALMEVNGVWNGEGRRIVSVADPISAQDVLTRHYYDKGIDNMLHIAGIVTDSGELQHIVNQFNTIDTNTQKAVNAANTATTKAASATASATSAAGSATSATNTANALVNFLESKETLTAPAVDPTLTISGAAADAKVTGDIILPIKSLTNPSYTWKDSFIVDQYGNEVSSGTYSLATVTGNYRKLHIKTYLASVASISFYDADDQFINSYIERNTTITETIVDITLPIGAVKTKISCAKANKSSFEVYSTVGNIYDGIMESVGVKADLPLVDNNVDYTIEQGILNINGSIYNPSESYNGRHAEISVNPNEIYAVSGYSTNNNYPCVAMRYGSGGIRTILKGNAVDYNNAVIQVPYGVTSMIVNGFTTVGTPINIVKLEPMTQEKFEELLDEEKINSMPCKAKYSGGILYIKRKYDATRDICLTFGNVGGNSLFNFRSLYYVPNTTNTPNDDFTATSQWGMSGSDWLGPYVVSAVNNIDGDNPTSRYFTGGNHRTTNTGTGGGVTATQTNLSIKVDGVRSMQEDVIYSCNNVVATWTNAVQAYNTSKADGSGRPVLTETWTMETDVKNVKLHNEIEPTESIVLETYYGLQATCGGMQYRYVGGANRGTYTAGTDIPTSGNNTCRTVAIWNDTYNASITIDAVDLGLFTHNSGNSFFATNSSKIYSSLIRSSLEMSAGEHYDLVGKYTLC